MENKMKYELIQKDGQLVVHIDTAGLVLPKLDFDVEDLLCFEVGKTYSRFTNTSTDPAKGPGVVFDVVESFYNTLTSDEQTQVVLTIIYMHYLVIQNLKPENFKFQNNNEDDMRHNKTVMYNLQEQLANYLNSLDQNINLLPRLLDYSQENIPLVEQSNLGNRAQDSDAKTFYLAEQRQIISISVLCKILSPIMGVFIELCKKIGIDSDYIEVHCNVMFKYVFNNRYADLMDKLDNYVGSIVEKKLRNYKSKGLYTGQTRMAITTRIFASVFTRKLVVVDLFSKSDSTIMVYLHRCMESTVMTASLGNNRKLGVTERDLPSSTTFGDSDDGNDSILESESMTSAKTGDFELLTSWAIDDVINKYIKDYDIDTNVLNSAYMYYSSSKHLLLDITSSYILGIVFGNEMLGANSIDMIGGKDLAKIIPLLQILLTDWGYYDLVHVVSLIPTSAVKVNLTGAEQQLSSNWLNNQAWRNCNDRFIYTASCNSATINSNSIATNIKTRKPARDGIVPLRWDSGLELLVKSVTTMKYAYNTAPAILEYMDNANNSQQIVANSAEYFAPFDLSELICRLILSQTDKEM